MSATVPLVFALTSKEPVIPTTSVSGDHTISPTDRRLEYDATSGNITVTFPTITNSFKNKGSIEHKRIDTSANTVTFDGVGGNLEDEGYELGSDPQLESFRNYASDANIWRTL